MPEESNELVKFHEPPKPGTEFEITNDPKRANDCCKCRNEGYCEAERKVMSTSLTAGQMYSFWVSS